MSLLAGITNFLTGGIGSQIVGKVLKQFPDKLSESEKSLIQKAIIDSTREYELKLMQFASDQDKEFNSRIKDLEGTAKDLQQFGVIGKIVVFLRGLQRPLWGFFVMFMDYMVFSGSWNLPGNEPLSGMNIVSCFWIINLLVLVFLFGERAIKNVGPILKALKK